MKYKSLLFLICLSIVINQYKTHNEIKQNISTDDESPTAPLYLDRI